MSQGKGNDFDAAPAPQQVSLTARTASGLRWSYIGSAGLVVANLAYTATISRLLSPAAFGLVALANLVVLFAQFFARMGLSSALVQKPELSKEDIRAASTAGVALGVACLALVWVLTPAISALFREPALAPILRALSVSFIFQGWSMTAIGLLQREHRFRELSMVTVAAYVLGSAAGVGSALLGAGVWSLVVASLTTNSALAILQYLLVRHPVRPVLRWGPYRTLGGYGSRLVGAHLMDYVGSNLDTFVVGRVASTSVLGQYSRAYSLIVLPLRFHLTQALTNVLFSQLSRIQDDAARLRRAYLSVLAIMGVILFPACAWIAVVAPELVLVVLGPQWDLTAAIVPWFALAGCSSVISALSQSFLEVRADLNRSLAMQCAYLLVLGALLVLALEFQSRGVWVFAAAVAAGETIRHVGYLALVRRSLHLSAAQVARSYAPASFASVGVVLAVASIRWVLVEHVPVLVLFAVEVAVGGLALALFIRLYPATTLRHELWLRLTSAGVLGGVGGLRWRLALLVLGRPAPPSKPVSRP